MPGDPQAQIRSSAPVTVSFSSFAPQNKETSPGQVPVCPTSRIGSNSPNGDSARHRDTTHGLCELGQDTHLLCASVSTSAKGGGPTGAVLSIK